MISHLTREEEQRETEVQVIPRGELEIAQEVTALTKSECLAPHIAVLAQLDLVVPKIRVRSDEDEAKALETIVQAQKAIKGIEEIYSEVVAPANKWLQMVRNAFGPSSVIVTKAKKWIEQRGPIKTEIAAYRNRKRIEAQRLLKKEQERIDRERERMEKRAEKDGVDPSVVPEMRVTERKVETTVKTESGATSYTVRVPSFEVTDLKKLAQAAIDGKVGMNVIEANMEGIRAVYRSGIEKIPGVSIEIKEEIRTRRG